MKIFVVEDDEFYAAMLKYHLELNPDNEVHSFHSAEKLFQSLHLNPDVITLDYSLPDASGEEVLSKLVKQLPDSPILIISGQEDIGTAVQLLNSGAYDYIVKDENTKERLWNVLIRLKERSELKNEIIQLRQEVQSKYEFSNTIIGDSTAIQGVFKLMEKAANSLITVSVYGETGTGKELVAKSIHYNSKLAKKPFVAVNMAAIPNELIESELFGHEKGAFTGAVNRRIGKFEEANGGTLFLDEIGELNINMQAKILRALQEQEITRVGGNKTIKFNARIIVATHRNLPTEVKNGKFREDLFYRLLGLNIELPPLRERGSDILLLSKHFIEDYCKKNKCHQLKLSKSAQSKLMGYSFPGNIRELKAICDLSCVMATENTIEEADIQFHSLQDEERILTNELTLKEYNNRIIKYFLNKYNDDVLLVAEKLDIGKSTIYNLRKSGEV